jgi:DNA-binding LacI/PurR family transcriptional regulator
MVSVKDIAAACNVSVATVSKALNGYSDISETTKQMVRDKAAELGYLPNLAAVALKTNRTYNIGVLFIDDAHNGLTHEFFARVLQGVKAGAESRGYDITFINNRLGGKKVTYTEHCRYRGFDGVVIACIDFNDPQVIELVHSEIPVVTIDHVFNETISVVSDNVKGIHDLVHYVAGMGHRRIAFIHGADSAVSRDRVTSFYRCAEELGIDIPDEYILECRYRDTVKAGKCTKKLLDLKAPPTCIFFPDDYTAMGGINVIKERGLRIPEDISVVGYDGTSYARLNEPPLTTLAQDTDKLGRTASERLIELIERPKTTLTERVVVEGSISIGKSVKDIR